MGELVEFGVAGGDVVLVDVRPTAGLVTRGGQAAVQDKAQMSFEQAAARVRPAAEALLESMAGLSRTPDRVVVEFGVGFSAEAGAFIGSLGADANFKVALTWSPRDP